jgi:hypothetical protein
MTNYTSGHETLAREPGESRFDYPEGHIEADNRLAWFLGKLQDKFGDDAFYVHLKRDEQKTAESYLKRIHIRNSVVHAFAEGVYLTPLEKMNQDEKRQVCLDYVRTVNQNIFVFLDGKPHKMEMNLENMVNDFREFWHRIGAEGNLEEALVVLNKKHNASKKGKIRPTFRYRSKLFLLRLKNKVLSMFD